ncbi:PREDICTED: uncharacterized protein LOC104608836 isoform X2 [Nelumbo nucifera]|uniref:Uncharacterized protein LOC104608836 isoform X2 n=2 Tax=Nelumbo nucifera TaxID=4432 RepID=A0A1U8BAS3_NELNU|nr:PREDICTED: uncharacterized protein LOC104608836 isoform X2 [Nelumbo nucifera]DAD42658.1 TPA_asm: hypothetical protein HUJ06_000888 [Nelumbo nucifera]
MDSIISAALEEICAQGTNGILLLDLWPKLQNSLSSAGLHLCNNVKSAIWTRIISIPGLHFEADNSPSTSYSSQDLSNQSFEESEKLRLKIVAAEHLRDSFAGLYDLKAADSGFSPLQRRTLERLAIARTDGITQSQLAKEFGLKGNKIFYIVRSLECRGLIVRQSTIVRTKEHATDGEGDCVLKNTSVVNTNLIHLYRYAKHLSSHERLEITKEDAVEGLGSANGSTTGVDVAGENVREDVLIKDYLPALKAVCDKLEEADGKVLVVSDIKQALGYRKTPGHRAWRHICNRLKDAHLVEEFRAEVNKKVVTCLRLLKRFDPKHFQTKALGCGYDDHDTDQMVKHGKRGQVTDQLVELPLEHQIHDMIDASGSKGLTVTEVCKRLGLNNKRNYTRLLNMFSRFGMQLQAESHNRGMAYRVWTAQNFNRGASIAFPSRHEDTRDGSELSSQSVGDLVLHEKSAPSIVHLDSSASVNESSTPGTVKEGGMNSETCLVLSGDATSNQMVVYGSQPKDLPLEIDCTVPDAERDLVNKVTKSNIVPPGTSSLIFSKPAKLQSCQRYPCLTLAAINTQRERRILERLQEEKFVLAAELHRWLESLEKEKPTTMARKTLNRTLNKLQQEGLCKCVHISVPVVTNCGRSRTTEVVLHPSVQSLPPELLSQIHEKMRSFDIQSRGQGLARLKKDESVPVLNGVQRTQNHVVSDVQAARSEAMRANGFVLAKMVRAKLLHNFLWCYLSSSSDWGDALSSGKHGYDLKNPHSTCKLFSMNAAIKAMPLELFLQVVGSTLKFENLMDSCKRGLRLSDLPVQEYRCLMSTLATGRLSCTVDILRRLKLIRLVTDGRAEQDTIPHAVLTHAMELKPYIEEPLSIVPPSSGVTSIDLRPRVRHDFILSNKDAVDAYWKTLEFCYAAANPTAALHAFPGSAVHEVFFYRSWASVRVMTAEQRAELLKRVVKDGPNKKLSFRECEKIAKDLNLTLQQVLRVYYDKRQQRLSRFQRDSETKGQEFQPVTSKSGSASRKRKKHTETRKLVMQYVRHRAALGAKFNRTDWGSLPDLPAPPDTCRRRMALLNSNLNFRIELMKLCNLLGERYAKNLKNSQGKKSFSRDYCGQMVHDSSLDACRNSNDVVNNLENNFEVQAWDDFEDEAIKMALDEVLQCIRMPKMEALRRVKEAPEREWSDLNLDAKACDAHEDPQSIPSSAVDEEIQNHVGRRRKDSGRRSGCHRLPGKFLKLLNEGINVSRRAYESLAVSNAVELLKLVFLNSSTAPEVPKLLAETLRRYSEHDLFSAFNYLREKKFMVGGNDSQPFVLSQQFLHSVSSSPFPTNTGKRAAKFSSWINEREKGLTEEGVHLDPDLQCGDIFHLLALVYAGELFISPCLPDKGIGEAEEQRGLKRKSDTKDLSGGDKVKKPRSLITKDGEFTSRREKGFPGIMVSVGRVEISRVDALELFKNEEMGVTTLLHSEQNQATSVLATATDLSLSNHFIQSHNFGSNIPISHSPNEFTWEYVASYAEHLVSTFLDQEEQIGPFHSELFKTIYAAIRKAGDQGLTMEAVSQVLGMHGEKMVELTVDVLQVFGLALKVNAYDSVHVVDALYRSKYFLSSVAGHYQDLNPTPSMNSSEMNDNGSLILLPENHDVGTSGKQMSINIDDIHKVTILNLPEEVSQPSNEIQSRNGFEDHMQVKVASSEGIHKNETFKCARSRDCHSFWPILPWINGDGTTNLIVYKGLARRVLGTVMQNPGILQDDLVRRMDVLNPQSCKRLLELMVLDSHLIVRKMYQTISSGPPALLGNFLGNLRSTESICREHYFANPMSTSLL